MYKQRVKIYDSQQIHTAIAAKDKAQFFQKLVSQNADQLTTGTNTPYAKTFYHTNMENLGTQQGEELELEGIKIWMDEVDSLLVEQALILSEPLFQLYGPSEMKLFEAPVQEIVKFKRGTSVLAFDAQTSGAKAQKKQALCQIFTNGEFIPLKPSIVIQELKFFKAVITFGVAQTFKKISFDYGTAAANAAYTTAWNLFVEFDAIRTVR